MTPNPTTSVAASCTTSSTPPSQAMCQAQGLTSSAGGSYLRGCGIWRLYRSVVWKHKGLTLDAAGACVTAGLSTPPT